MRDDETQWRADLVREWARARRALEEAAADQYLMLQSGANEFDLEGALRGEEETTIPRAAWDLAEATIRPHVIAGLRAYVAALRAAIDGPYRPGEKRSAAYPG